MEPSSGELETFREKLYTINQDGSRRWVYPVIPSGQIYYLRRAVSWVLMAIYCLLPWVTIGSDQAVHLDIINRKFVFFGSTFWATDTIFLVLILAGLGISLFFFTAILGRVWCGWACPETVFLEFLFRPIETLIEGNPTKRRRLDESPTSLSKITKKSVKYLVFSVISWFLASTFLAYFVGRSSLIEMMQHSPSENLSMFLLTCFFMAVLLFQFGWFREQFCTVLCPYARFQSVLLDSNSLIVGYDKNRGEPRTKSRKKSYSEGGDCVDCGLCIRVCPTGIDIRNGTQLECIHCAACVDACNSIMRELDRPTGLIRYDTDLGFQGKRSSFLRPRLFLYVVILLGILSSFIYLVSTRSLSEYQIVRGMGDAPFSILPDGTISNHVTLRISNKSEIDDKFSISIESPKGVTLVVPMNPFPVPRDSMLNTPLFLSFPVSLLSSGSASIVVSVTNMKGEIRKLPFSLVGPGR